MPEYENRWPCLWCCSPHFITFSSSELAHISKTMWNYHGRWKVQRVWCQNTAKHLRLSTYQANPWQLQRTWETCIPASVAPLQLIPHLQLILCFPSTCPEVRLAAASCSHFQRNVMTRRSQGLKRKERRVFWAAAWRGAETQHRETGVAGLHASSFYPRSPQVLTLPDLGCQSELMSQGKSFFTFWRSCVLHLSLLEVTVLNKF